MKPADARELAIAAIRNAFLLGQWPARNPLSLGVMIALDHGNG